MKYPTINMKETGNRIKKACMERGITAKEIKEYMNLTSAQSVYGWFRGKNLPSLDNFYALSRLLGVTMEELICASDKKKKEETVILYEVFPGICQEVWGNRLYQYRRLTEKVLTGRGLSK